MSPMGTRWTTAPQGPTTYRQTADQNANLRQLTAHALRRKITEFIHEISRPLGLLRHESVHSGHFARCRLVCFYSCHPPESRPYCPHLLWPPARSISPRLPLTFALSFGCQTPGTPAIWPAAQQGRQQHRGRGLSGCCVHPSPARGQPRARDWRQCHGRSPAQ